MDQLEYVRVLLDTYRCEYEELNAFSFISHGFVLKYNMERMRVLRNTINELELMETYLEYM